MPDRTRQTIPLLAAMMFSPDPFVLLILAPLPVLTSGMGSGRQRKA
jgi:hypothetical protein